MDQMAVEADVSRVEEITDFVNEHLAGMGCSEHTRIQVDVAVDEIFSNIVHYAYPSGKGEITVRVGSEGNPLRVMITFIDRGVPYNPLAKELPDITGLPKNARPIGGLGQFMVRKTMDDVSYSYEDGQNRLTICKRL